MKVVFPLIPLTALLFLAGCGRCTVGSLCTGISQTDVDSRIEKKDTPLAQKKADCAVLGYHQTLDFGSGCVIEWK